MIAKLDSSTHSVNFIQLKIWVEQFRNSSKEQQNIPIRPYLIRHDDRARAGH